MELYLDSVDFKEIEAALDYGFIKGLTTTPTFMHRHGITDIDGAIVKLSKMVPELQVEALGDTPDQIVAEAERIMGLGLERPPVFKVPISNEGVKGCQRLRARGYKVNVHLIYTLNQAYMAMEAGASFICPLAGRMQDQGHDAIQLFEQCVDVIDRYGYDSKVMFSSVRHAEHVRQAMLTGVHVCTMPFSVMKNLCENTLTALGTAQFREHTALMTQRVKDVIRQGESRLRDRRDAVLRDGEDDGVAPRPRHARRLEGRASPAYSPTATCAASSSPAAAPYSIKSLATIGFSKTPLTIDRESLLNDAVKVFKKAELDSIVVVDGTRPVGVLDVQDLIKLGLLGQEHL